MRSQVEAFYDAKLASKGNVVVSETAIIAELQPAPIATELVQILYSETIERVPIFSKLEEEVIVKLCLLLVPIPALKDSPVVIQGRVGSEMYIIIKGKLQVWESSKTSVTRVKCVHGGLYFWATAYDPETFPEGTIDLHGKGDLPELRPRALIMTMESALQGIVRNASTRQPREGSSGTFSRLRQSSSNDITINGKVPAAILSAPTETNSSGGAPEARPRERRGVRRASVVEAMGAAYEGVTAAMGLGPDDNSTLQDSAFFVDFDPALGTFATHKGELKDLREGSRVDVLEVRRGTVLGYLTSGEYFGEASLIAEGHSDPNLRYLLTMTRWSGQYVKFCELRFVRHLL
eukprot:COSAG05_NODE_865_length_6876_cov_357.169396_6_plen_348_part_00